MSYSFHLRQECISYVFLYAAICDLFLFCVWLQLTDFRLSVLNIFETMRQMGTLEVVYMSKGGLE